MGASFRTLRRWWVGLSILHVLLLVYGLDYVLGRPITPFSILLAGSTLIGVGVVAFTLFMTPARLAMLRRRVRPFIWVMVVAGWVGLLLLGSMRRGEWIYNHIPLVLAATLTLVFVTLTGPSATIRQPRRWALVGLGVVIAVLALRLAALSYYPHIQLADEGWTVGWAQEYNDTGVLSNRITGNPQDQSVVRFYVLMAYWLRLVGAGLWQARLFTFLLSLVVIGFSMWAALNLYSRRTAITTALALFASAVLGLSTRSRHDIGLALAVAVSLWLYSEALKRERGWLHGLAGLAIGWGAFGHYNAVALGSAMVVGLYGPRYVVRLRQGKFWPERALWFYGLGGLIAGLHVAVVQVWPTYQATGSFLTAGMERPATPIAVFHRGLEHLSTLRELYRYEYLLILLGVGAALWRRRVIDWSLALVAILTPFTLAMFTAWPADFYHIPSAPVFGILIGSLFGEGLRHPRVPGAVSNQLAGSAVARPASAQASMVAAVSFLVVALGATLAFPWKYTVESRLPVIPAEPEEAQWISTHFESGTTVVGEHFYYLWLLEYDFLSPYLPHPPGGYGKHTPYEGMTLGEVWALQAVDVFIVNPEMPATPVLLQPLVDDGFFEARGYKEAVLANGTSIYYRPPVHIDSLADAPDG